MKYTDQEMNLYWKVIAGYIFDGEIELRDFKNKEDVKCFVSFVQRFIVPETANKIVLHVIDLIY